MTEQPKPDRMHSGVRTEEPVSLFTLEGLWYFALFIVALLAAHGVVEQGSRLLPW